VVSDNEQIIERVDERINPSVAKYVSISGDRKAGEYRAVLKVGVQSFNINYEDESREQAEWTANMLRIALTNLVQRECAAMSPLPQGMTEAFLADIDLIDNVAGDLEHGLVGSRIRGNIGTQVKRACARLRALSAPAMASDIALLQGVIAELVPFAEVCARDAEARVAFQELRKNIGIMTEGRERVIEADKALVASARAALALASPLVAKGGE
jgi:hypothetical protein